MQVPINQTLTCYQGLNGPYNCTAHQLDFPFWLLWIIPVYFIGCWVVGWNMAKLATWIYKKVTTK